MAVGEAQAACCLLASARKPTVSAGLSRLSLLHPPAEIVRIQKRRRSSSALQLRALRKVSFVSDRPTVLRPQRANSRFFQLEAKYLRDRGSIQFWATFIHPAEWDAIGPAFDPGRQLSFFAST